VISTTSDRLLGTCDLAEVEKGNGFEKKKQN
jgi:hypothetical protein